MKMMVVGLTGGIVSGKTTVAKMFKKLGAEVIDIDKIAHEVILPHKKAWKEIVQHFGEGILNKNQEIHRKKLAHLVFTDPKKLKLLNELTHPEIIALMKERIKHLKRQSNHNVICIIDAPLLFEAHIDELMDKIIVVYINQEQQIERLVSRDSLEREEAIKRIESQMPLEQKVCLADYVIDNRRSLHSLKKQVIQVWKDLQSILPEFSKSRNSSSIFQSDQS